MSRGMRFILSFVVMAVLISITGVALAYFLGSGGPTIETNSVLWLRVPDSLGEQEADDVFGLISQRDTVLSLVSTLRKAKADERISAVVRIPPITEGLWGKVQEIRDAVIDFKESDKPIVAYLEYGTGQAYYLASACDEIFMTPTSPLNLIGVSSYEVFLREALDKVGFQADMLSAGDYKTAVNLYTETTFTAEHREMAQSLNRDIYEQLVAGISEGRELTLARVRALIDDGPYRAADTVRVGLVDALVYEDQLIDGLPLGSTASIVDYADYRQVILPGETGSRVALVYAEGVINFGSNGNDLQGNQTVGSDTMASAIRAAREDDADVMWREIDLASAEKPLIVSMSALAASGGYYIAAPADVIVAHPGTLTGSMGVYGGKYVAGETLGKLGVNVEVVTDGAHADLFSPTTRFSESAREAVQAQIDDTYERFLQVVAGGRGLSRDEVHQMAQGRVWTGRQAYDNGLVDELGGFHRAIEVAKAEAGIAEDSPVDLVTYPQPRAFFEVLRNSFGVGATRGAIGVLISPFSEMLRYVLGPLPLGYVQGAPMVLMPAR